MHACISRQLRKPLCAMLRSAAAGCTGIAAQGITQVCCTDRRCAGPCSNMQQHCQHALHGCMLPCYACFLAKHYCRKRQAHSPHKASRWSQEHSGTSSLLHVGWEALDAAQVSSRPAGLLSRPAGAPLILDCISSPPANVQVARLEGHSSATRLIRVACDMHHCQCVKFGRKPRP